MAGTAKVLKDINYTREEISHLVDILSKKRNTKRDLIEIINEKPLNVAIATVILGVFAALLSKKIIKILKFAFLVYGTKKSISHLLKK